MKRIGLVLLAVVMVAGVVGCSSGGNSDPFDFTGRWTGTGTAVSNVTTPCGGTDFIIGKKETIAMTITQNGSDISLVLEGGGRNWAAVGTANGSDFNATTQVITQGMAIRLQGSSQSANTVTGSWKLVCNGNINDTVIATYTITK